MYVILIKINRKIQSLDFSPKNQKEEKKPNKNIVEEIKYMAPFYPISSLNIFLSSSFYH